MAALITFLFIVGMLFAFWTVMSGRIATKAADAPPDSLAPTESGGDATTDSTGTVATCRQCAHLSPPDAETCPQCGCCYPSMRMPTPKPSIFITGLIGCLLLGCFMLASMQQNGRTASDKFLKSATTLAESESASFSQSVSHGGDFMSQKTRDALERFKKAEAALILAASRTNASPSPTSHGNTDVPPDGIPSDHEIAALERRIPELQQELSDIEQEAMRRLLNGEKDISDLQRRLARNRQDMMTLIRAKNRKPWEAGYTIEERRKATYLSLMQKGYSPSEAYSAVELMEKGGTLPDPPRR